MTTIEDVMVVNSARPAEGRDHAAPVQVTVSVGMPVYNGAKYLAKAIEGLRAQTADDVEIIVSDDASQDESPQLLAGWAAQDPRVTVTRHERNLGTIANFEWLVENAEGEYFMWAAQDDCWSTNYIAGLRETLWQNPQADLAAGANVLLSEDWVETRRIEFPLHSAPGGLFHRQHLLRHARNGWFYGLYRRDVLLKALPLVSEFGHAWGHDFVTLLPFLLTGRVCANNDVVYYQRITTRSADTLKPRSVAIERRLYRDFLRASVKALTAAPLNAAERAYLAPFVAKYAGRHSIKLRHLLLRHFEFR
ncbi:MAG: glycosyltransferase family 2 protein [Hyphomicrobiaceae bacterium]